MKQTFLRPLAIGYRAVKRIPKDNLIDPSTDTGKAKVAATKAQDCFKGLSDCTSAELGSAPPLAVNTAQVPNSTKQDTNDPKRFRLYLHTAGQPEETVARVKEALAKGGYAVQGTDPQSDDQGGAGVDFFSDVDFVGGANVAKIISGIVGSKDPAKAIVPRRQKVYNPIGVLGVWLTAKQLMSLTIGQARRRAANARGC